jgi:hypothetical protein
MIFVDPLGRAGIDKPMNGEQATPLVGSQRSTVEPVGMPEWLIQERRANHAALGHPSPVHVGTVCLGSGIASRTLPAPTGERDDRPDPAPVPRT